MGIAVTGGLIGHVTEVQPTETSHTVGLTFVGYEPGQVGASPSYHFGPSDGETMNDAKRHAESFRKMLLDAQAAGASVNETILADFADAAYKQ